MIRGLFGQGPTARSVVSASLPAAGSRLRQILDGCAVLEAIACKSERIQYLEWQERRTVIEAIGVLPEQERQAALEELLPASQRRRTRPPPAPISCARIRERHSPIAREVGCCCQFRQLGNGAYPTPALHTMSPRDIAAMRSSGNKHKRTTTRQGRRSSVPAAEETAGRNLQIRTAEKKVADLRLQVANAQRGLARAEAELIALRATNDDVQDR